VRTYISQHLSFLRPSSRKMDAASSSTEQVGWSITAPQGFAERLLGRFCGNLGLIHQYIAWLAVCSVKAVCKAFYDRVKSEGVQALVAGIIWNDFPLAPEGDLRAYVSFLERVPLSDAEYLPHPDFRWQVRKPVRRALAGHYKNFPDWLLHIFGIAQHDCDVGERMLKYRAAGERVHYHGMKETGAETDASVKARARARLIEWYGKALRAPTIVDGLFLVGHMVHLVEDFCSPAHTNMDKDGHLTSIYFFGDQTDLWHSKRESADVVFEKGSEAQRRIAFCVPLVRALLMRFVEDYGAPVPPDETERARDEVVMKTLN